MVYCMLFHFAFLTCSHIVLKGETSACLLVYLIKKEKKPIQRAGQRFFFLSCLTKTLPIPFSKKHHVCHPYLPCPTTTLVNEPCLLICKNQYKILVKVTGLNRQHSFRASKGPSRCEEPLAL